MIRLFRGAIALLLAAPAAAAQQPSLGRISFPSSGRAEAQPFFTRGVLYLHSFEYDSAARAFREAQRLDPTYALAYWGEAMTYTHPVWHEQDVAAARESLRRLAPGAASRRAMAPTAREKRWLDAVEILYGEGSKERRDTLYAREMERFARDFPGDHEVSAFHALALLGLPTQGRDVSTYMRAAAIAEEVYRENPEHPGALHYLIHAYDDPIHAPLGLRAARAYSGVAPSAAHAQHMTSHIFVAMGMWDDVERANLAAWEASNRRNGHYTHWLSYGYLQKGRVKESRAFVDAIVKDAAADPTPYTLGYMNVMLAGFLADADGGEASLAIYAADTARRAGARGEFRVGASALDFAAGMTALKRGDAATARRMRGAIAERNTVATRTAAGAHVDGLAASEIMGQMLDALTMAGDGRMESAISAMREAAEREATLPFEFGPPETVKPPYEVLGELLLAASRPAEARTAFERALQRTPNRTRALLGLARACVALGDTTAGVRVYARFLANGAGTAERNADRQEAEGFLAAARR